MTLTYADAFLDAGVDWIHSVHASVDRFPFEELEARSVALACPLNEATHHPFDAAAFEAMRGDAALLIVARGAAVDEEALVEALDAGEISGAGLDVFEAEPLRRPRRSRTWAR